MVLLSGLVDRQPQVETPLAFYVKQIDHMHVRTSKAVTDMFGFGSCFHLFLRFLFISLARD